MDMNKQTTDDDLLVSRFLKDHAPDVADNGFSRRVMAALPARTSWLSRCWTAFCLVIALALLIYGRVFDTLRGMARGLWADVVTNDLVLTSVPLSCYLVCVAIAVIGSCSLLAAERSLLR